MSRAALALIVVASALAGAIAAKLHTRWTAQRAQCANVDCAYLAFRLGAIRNIIATKPEGPTYLIIGDSLTERARWPRLCGMHPLPAGIGGARTDTWQPYVGEMAASAKPALIVLALGTNDVLTNGRLGPYEEIVASLAGAEVVAVPIHTMPRARPGATREANQRIVQAIPRAAAQITAITTDGIHLTEADEKLWLGALEKAACRS